MAPRLRVGIVTDPDVPQTTAEWLADTLPDTLNDDYQWTIEVEVDTVAAGQRNVGDIVKKLVKHTAEHAWDYAICLTDLPLRHDRRPVLADVSLDERVAVMALPALGGIQPARRARQLITQVLDDLTTPSEQVEDNPGESRQELQNAPTRLLAPIHREETTTDQGHVDVRYYATRRRVSNDLVSRQPQ